MTLNLHRSTSLLLLALFAAALALYSRGLLGGFLFDDYPNIVDNDLLGHLTGSWQSWYRVAVSYGEGLTARPLGMLSFAANVHAFGMDAAAFKLVNIGIHLLSGWLAYRLALRLIPTLLTRSATANNAGGESAQHLLALLVAALWLLHPLHVSNVLYVVQRMNLLAALFSLATLWCYAELRCRQLRGTGPWLLHLAGMVVFTLFALCSKENAVLVVPFIVLIEACCFRLQGAGPSQQRWILRGLAFAVLVPSALLAVYLIRHPDWIAGGYVSRDFDLATRLLTQARVVLHYLLWTFVPNIHWMGLYHDDIAYSTSLSSPWTTLPALLTVLLAPLLAWRLRHALPGVSFAIGWFFVGHALESTVLPLEMVFEHRQYLPMYGVLLGAVASLANLATRWPRPFAAAAVSVVVLLAALTAQRSKTWGDPLTLMLSMAQDHPDSPRSQYDAGRALIDQAGTPEQRMQRRVAGRVYFLRAMQLSADYVHPASSLVMTYQGQPLVPDEALQQLIRRTAVMSRLSPLPVLLVIRTAAVQQLAIPQASMAALVHAAMENPDMDKLSQGLVLTNYGNYLSRVAKDPQAAIAVTLAAIELEPRYALFQLNAAYLAEQLGQVELARQHLANARLLDSVGEYDEQIEWLGRKLDLPAAQ